MQLEKKFSTIEELTADKHTANRLFASFIGLGAVMLRVRHATLSYPPIGWIGALASRCPGISKVNSTKEPILLF